jgi:hypothetical protein
MISGPYQYTTSGGIGAAVLRETQNAAFDDFWPQTRRILAT